MLILIRHNQNTDVSKHLECCWLQCNLCTYCLQGAWCPGWAGICLLLAQQERGQKQCTTAARRNVSLQDQQHGEGPYNSISSANSCTNRSIAQEIFVPADCWGCGLRGCVRALALKMPPPALAVRVQSSWQLPRAACFLNQVIFYESRGNGHLSVQRPQLPLYGKIQCPVDQLWSEHLMVMGFWLSFTSSYHKNHKWGSLLAAGFQSGWKKMAQRETKLWPQIRVGLKTLVLAFNTYARKVFCLKLWFEVDKSCY